MKRNIYINSPAYLSCQDKQLKITDPFTQSEKGSIPIEDIGLLIFDHYQITLTHYLFQQVMQSGGAIVSCDDKHIPHAISLPFTGNNQHTQRIRQQAAQTQQHKNRLWKQIIVAKIENQAALLRQLDKDANKLKALSRTVKTGDKSNREAVAAKHYWGALFGHFIRDRYGTPPNHLLNYGYAILRSLTCQSLSQYGLHLALGIHHIGKYNPTCLADDLMEPYRPYVDAYIIQYLKDNPNQCDNEITSEVKKALFPIGQIDVLLNQKIYPLQIAINRSAKSLMNSLNKENYPLELPNLGKQLCSTDSV
ncbi:type II CRISPR-associated endonuclease Cas1 [Ostreibacterium oceani]|uniref:CRISPR-associated endonuclease Cas1 n=1 Tax=Ostreibacterium oceani TaxID=2654998 RepID=A0A6N7ESD5_9GAMM|nr:type II CRISPR-associated endonuclease Cas1 [Ostreibacterium oceani]MPV85451.1 type II CRISPR-associated endonuclease Cas1 [Ostreibacterium oceani]